MIYVDEVTRLVGVEAYGSVWLVAAVADESLDEGFHFNLNGASPLISKHLLLVERHNPKGSPVLYRCLIDITFNVFSGTPKGKAPDLYSPTLRPKGLL